MVRAKDGRMAPRNGPNSGLSPELPVEKVSHLPAVPPLGMDKVSAEREIAVIEVSDLKLRGFRTVGRKVKDGNIQKVNVPGMPDGEVKGFPCFCNRFPWCAEEEIYVCADAGSLE